jgi:hypothetical protein
MGGSAEPGDGLGTALDSRESSLGHRSELAKLPEHHRRSPDSQPTSCEKQAKDWEVTDMDTMSGRQRQQHGAVRNGLHDDQSNGQKDQQKGQDPALRVAAQRGLHGGQS